MNVDADDRPSLCMVVHAYYPLAEPRVQRAAMAARDAGYGVSVFALREDGEPANELVDGVRVRRVGLTHKRGAGIRRMVFEYLTFCALASWWLAIRSIRRPFDIVHIHNPPDFLIVAGLVPRLRGSKLILDVHDLSSHMFSIRMPGAAGAIVSRVLVRIERAAGVVAAKVITVHDPYRFELINHGLSSRKVHVVMNSVDDGILERARSTPPLTERAGAFRLAYHGTLTAWYGTDLILDALARLRAEGIDAEAVLLGDGDQLPALRERIAGLQLEDHVFLSGGYVSIEAAIATAATADCGVIPNRPSEINRFALSSKLFEYVAIGIPVVVSRLETLSAYFSEDEVTFFNPGDAESLAVAIHWIYEHPESARAKAKQAQLRARDYSWARSRDELTRIYRELSDGHSGSGRSDGQLDSVVTGGEVR